MTRTAASLASRAFATVIRILAFVRKDVADFVGQPRLVLALVLGPFLIMLLFGLGFKAEPPPLRTVIVVSRENPLRPYVEENANQLILQLVLEGILESEAEARGRLASGEIDLAIIVPENALETIRSNERPAFVTLHRAIDPIEINYIRAFTDMLVNIANRRTLAVAVEAGREETAQMEPEIRDVHESASRVHLALREGNVEGAQEHLTRLRENLGRLQAALGPVAWLMSRQEDIVEPSSEPGPELEDLLAEMETDLEALSGLERDEITRSEAMERAADLEREMGRLQTAIDEFRRMDPDVVVRPFAGETKGIGGRRVDASDYYVPGTVALLLQHLSITLGGLSIVHERRTGTMEVFRASPLAAIEVLVGKYVGYWMTSALVAGALTGLPLLAVGVPMAGSWWRYAAIIGTLIFTSLGLGFLVSIAARSTGQAVQFAMIVLLASVFFSGFFLQLDRLRPAVRLVSWALPVSYGIRLLQDVMLRGLPYEAWRVLILLGMGLAFFVAAWLGLRRELART